MRKLPLTAAEELLEIIIRYERASTLIHRTGPLTTAAMPSAAVDVAALPCMDETTFAWCALMIWRVRSSDLQAPSSIFE